MLIPFESMETQVIPNMKGGEKEAHSKIFFDGLNKIIQLTLEPGASVGLHTHEGNSEIIYVLSGQAKSLYDGQWETLKPGDCQYCPMGHSHNLVNDGTEPLTVFAVVPQHGG